MDLSIFEDLPGMQEMLGSMDGMNSTGGRTDNSTAFPKNTPLAMAYVPYQQWGKTYSHEQGFERGTIFEDLDYPFEPEGGTK